MRRDPGFRGQVRQIDDPAISDEDQSWHDLHEVGDRVEVLEAARMEDRQQVGVAVPGVVAAEEEAVLADEGDDAQGVLGEVVVGRQATVGEEFVELVPVIDHVVGADVQFVAGRAFARDVLGVGFDPGHDAGAVLGAQFQAQREECVIRQPGGVGLAFDGEEFAVEGDHVGGQRVVFLHAGEGSARVGVASDLGGVGELGPALPFVAHEVAGETGPDDMDRLGVGAVFGVGIADLAVPDLGPDVHSFATAAQLRVFGAEPGFVGENYGRLQNLPIDDRGQGFEEIGKRHHRVTQGLARDLDTVAMPDSGLAVERDRIQHLGNAGGDDGFVGEDALGDDGFRRSDRDLGLSSEIDERDAMDAADDRRGIRRHQLLGECSRALDPRFAAIDDRLQFRRQCLVDLDHGDAGKAGCETRLAFTRGLDFGFGDSLCGIGRRGTHRRQNIHVGDRSAQPRRIDVLLMLLRRGHVLFRGATEDHPSQLRDGRQQRTQRCPRPLRIPFRLDHDLSQYRDQSIEHRQQFWRLGHKTLPELLQRRQHIDSRGSGGSLTHRREWIRTTWHFVEEFQKKSRCFCRLPALTLTRRADLDPFQQRMYLGRRHHHRR